MNNSYEELKVTKESIVQAHKVTVRHLVDLWSTTPEGQDLVARFNDRVSLGGIAKRA